MALAAVALVASTAAMAQVTMYGAVDTSVVGGSGIKANMDGTGNWNGTIYGFKGSEDLGGGMKAGFEIENGFSAATGAQANAGMPDGSAGNVGRPFNRKANVSVGGEFGTIKLGLQISPFIVSSLGGYVNNNESFYVRGLAMGSTSVTGTADGNTSGFFIPNAVSYSVTAGGVSASVLGQLSKGTANQEYTAASVGTSFGDVSVNAAYQSRGSVNDGYTSYNLNAATTVAGLKVAGGYTNHDPKVSSGTTSSTYNVGVQYPLTESLNGSVQYASSTGGKSLANIGLQYNLSKSTYLYTTIAQGTKTAVLYAGGPGTATSGSVTGYAIGVVTNF